MQSTQRGGAIKTLLIAFVGLLVLGGALAGGAAYLAVKEANRPGPHQDEQIVLLASGSSVGAIARMLEQNGVIRDARFFKVAVKVKGLGQQLKAGEYLIPANASLMEIIALLVEGKSILHYFTAAEGLTTAQVLRTLLENPVLEGEITLVPQEGTLLPETYAFSRGETRDALIKRMSEAQQTFLDDIWDGRALELPFSTREEALILASIVEKETGVAAERPRIAAVFVNRLRRGMRLESDPTIIYGLTKGEPLGRGLRLSELRGETPYNTYVIRGLPPTPIANPGKEAITAVLKPAQTDELFFVADGSGGHAFASTLREHNRNVARWRAIEKAQ